MELHGAGLSNRIKRLVDHIVNRDPNVSLKALDMSFKLDSSYPPQKNINLNTDVPIQPVIDMSEYE